MRTWAASGRAAATATATPELAASVKFQRRKTTVNILHLVGDEKFILFFDRVFASLPSIHNRYLLHGDPNRGLKHIVGLDVWRRFNKRYYLSGDIDEDLAWADCLVIHYLDGPGACMLLRAPSRVITVWSGWGADYYYLLPGGEAQLYGAQTAGMMKRLCFPRNLGPGRFGAAARALAFTTMDGLTRLLIKHMALKRVDYFSSPIAEDYHSLKRALGRRFGAKYAQLNYGSVEKTLMAGPDLPLGMDILVGNSATPTNNHVEAFELLATLGVGNRRVFVPMNYGHDAYRDAVLKAGTRILGDSFQPILEFLPLAKYNELISRCSIVVMNHRRQQALGTICTMLCRGAKVFLDEQNPVYGFFKGQGAHVYLMKMFDQRRGEVFDRLGTGEIAGNRAVVEKYWAHDVVMNNARDFIRRVGVDRMCRA